MSKVLAKNLREKQIICVGEGICYKIVDISVTVVSGFVVVWCQYLHHPFLIEQNGKVTILGDS